MPRIECPNCHTTMEEGFLLDRGDANVMSQQEWAEGEPQSSFWFGLKLKGRERLPVLTYRCTKCGLLQSYARAAEL